MWEPKQEHKQVDRVYKLKEFQELKSLTRKYVPKLNGHMAGNDPKFWELKLYIEHRIRDNGGEGSYVAFDMVLNHALAFYEFKDLSTARAKTRNIWNWYESREFKYHILKHKKDKEQVMATRRERALLNAQKRAKEAQAKVLNCVTGLMSSEYKKKNGDWNVAKIAKDMRLSRTTVYKYLREFELQEDLKKAGKGLA
jgi:hypothetical protein